MVSIDTQRNIPLSSLVQALVADSTLHPILFNGVRPKVTTTMTKVGTLGELPVMCAAVGAGKGMYLEMNFVIGSAGLKVLSDGLDALWKENFQRLHAVPERLQTWSFKDDEQRVKLSIPAFVVDDRMARPKLCKLPELVALLKQAHAASPISLAQATA